MAEASMEAFSESAGVPFDAKLAALAITGGLAAVAITPFLPMLLQPSGDEADSQPVASAPRHPVDDVHPGARQDTSPPPAGDGSLNVARPATSPAALAPVAPHIPERVIPPVLFSQPASVETPKFIPASTSRPAIERTRRATHARPSPDRNPPLIERMHGLPEESAPAPAPLPAVAISPTPTAPQAATGPVAASAEMAIVPPVAVADASPPAQFPASTIAPTSSTAESQVESVALQSPALADAATATEVQAIPDPATSAAAEPVAMAAPPVVPATPPAEVVAPAPAREVRNTSAPRIQSPKLARAQTPARQIPAAAPSSARPLLPPSGACAATNMLVQVCSSMALRPNSTAPATLGSMMPRRQQQAITAYRRTPRGIEFNTLARYRGAAIGNVAMLIRDKENISIRVRDIIEFVRPMMPPQEYQALSGSSQSDQFVTLNRLRSSGIPVHFNQNDELVFGS